MAVTEVTGYLHDNLYKRSELVPTVRYRGLLPEGELWGRTNGFLRGGTEKNSVGVAHCPGCVAWARRSWFDGWRVRKKAGVRRRRSMMHRHIARGPRNAGEGMRLGSLKAKYPKEYGELRAEWQGQQELL